MVRERPRSHPAGPVRRISHRSDALARRTESRSVIPAKAGTHQHGSERLFAFVRGHDGRSRGRTDEPRAASRVRPFVHLIEILLPLSDTDGKPFEADLYNRVRDELVEHFGGVTAFTRRPAEGLWKEGGGEPDCDEIVILEMMADWLDRGWWRNYRTELERRFRQDEIVVRAREVELL